MKYLPHIEWESLQNEQKFEINNQTKITSEINLNMVKIAKIKRNIDYKLILELIGKFDNENSNPFKEVYGPINMEIETFSEKIYLNLCIEIKHTIKFPDGKFEFVFEIGFIKRESKTNENRIKFIKEWYINSTSNLPIFKRVSSYEVKKEFIKKREIPQNKNIHIYEKTFPISSRDTLFFKLRDFSFLIQSVPKTFGPQWSNNLGIEYQMDLTIPSQKTRTEISAIISFLMGKYLLKIGETHFNENWEIIEEFSNNPNISSKVNLRKLCKSRNLNAIHFYEAFSEFYNIEEKISGIIEEYLNDEELDLSHIIQQLLISTTLPIEAEIMMIGASLDSLTKNWFNSSKSESKGKLIEKKQFDELMKDYIDNLKKTFSEHPKVLAKIENAFQTSGRQKVDFFLDELNLKIGDVENKAREYRNTPAHGQKLNKEKSFKLIYLTDVYRTLLNRIILKILNYEEYVDLISGNVLSIDDKLSKEHYNAYIEKIKQFY